MNRNERIVLVDELIKENRDVTIREYLDVVGEIESIENRMQDKPAAKNQNNGHKHRKHEHNIRSAA